MRALLLVTLIAAACRAEASTKASADHPDASVAPPDKGAEHRASDHPTVELDLSPSGIGATIRGPEGAKAAAVDGHVTVDAEPDFHMEVYRGPLDVLAEKADIVRRWGPAFRRFVQDDGKTVIYETETAGDNRYHFFSWGSVKDLIYHCKSDKRGAESIEAVKLMIVGCHAITAHDSVIGTP